MTLYESKQSPRIKFGSFARFVTCLGYKQAQGNNALFIKHFGTKGIITLLIYVNDIIITGDDEKEKLMLKKI